MQWHANWIWLSNRDNAPHTTVIARRAFSLNQQPQRATIAISAGQIYRLHVNGQYVGRGPCRSDPRWPFYDTYDIAPLLVAGNNTVVITAHHNRKPTGDIPQRVWCLYDGEGGVAAQVDIDGDIIATDDQWQIALAPGYEQSHDERPHKFHAYKHILDLPAWSRAHDAAVAGADDTIDWQTPVVTPIDGCENLGAPIAPEQPPLVRTPRKPHQIGAIQNEAAAINAPYQFTLGQDDAGLGAGAGANGGGITMDWGRPMGGFPVITFEAEGNAEIDLYYGEGSVWLQSDRLTLSAGTWTYEPLDWRGGRHMEIRFRSTDAPVHIKAARFDEMVYPFDPVGSFSCSDPTLTRTWDLCRTTAWVAVKDHPTDCVWREQALWLSDLYVHLCAMRACFGDLTPMIKGIRQALRTEQDGIISVPGPGGLGYTRDNPATLAWSEQPMTLTTTVAEHYNYTGDATLARHAMPHLERMMAHFARYEDERGLLDMTPPGLPSLSGFGGWNPKLNKGITSGFNFDYVLSLEAAARLADVTDRADLAAAYRTKADHIRQTVRELFWDDSRKLYIFGEHEGQRHEGVGLTVNAMAAMAGGVSHADRGSFAEALRCDPGIYPLTAPIDASFLLMALTTLDLELHVRQVLDDYYGSIVHADQPTLPEFWSCVDGTGGGLRGDASRCHPYGSGPAYICHDYVLGVRPTQPGWSDVVIRPRAIGLAEAHGRVPTPHGPLSVEWRKQNYQWHIEVDLPRGISATVILPQPGYNHYTLTADNQPQAHDDTWPDHKAQLLRQYTSDKPREVSHRFTTPGLHTLTLTAF